MHENFSWSGEWKHAKYKSVSVMAEYLLMQGLADSIGTVRVDVCNPIQDATMAGHLYRRWRPTK